MNHANYMDGINAFESKYDYDCTYMREILDASPEGYAKFDQVSALAAHRELLDLESYWVAKLAAMKAADCGKCLQLNVRLALEDGADVELVRACVKDGHGLSPALQDVYAYAQAVATYAVHDDELFARITSRYNKGQLLEFGLCISTAIFYPTIKRAVGYTQQCLLVDITL